MLSGAARGVNPRPRVARSAVWRIRLPGIQDTGRNEVLREASMKAERAVAGHYGKSGLEEKILAALVRAGIDVNNMTSADLAPVDEFHVGGIDSTKELAAQMELRKGMGLLDVGCGIGGPARYFAEESGCKVTGIDLTEEFVQVATALTRS